MEIKGKWKGEGGENVEKMTKMRQFRGWRADFVKKRKNNFFRLFIQTSQKYQEKTYAKRRRWAVGGLI